MKSKVRFDFACNDPDNGLFAHRVHAIHYCLAPNEYCEIEADTRDGYVFNLTDDGIRLHRRVFKVVGGKDWIGNWCWNAYVLQRPEAKRLISVLKSSGRWRCTQSPTRWFDWFNGPEPSHHDGQTPNDAPATSPNEA